MLLEDGSLTFLFLLVKKSKLSADNFAHPVVVAGKDESREGGDWSGAAAGSRS